MDELMIVPPDSGQSVWFGGFGVRFLLSGDRTDGRLSVVEHPLAPRALVAPMHTHTHEDEFSFVIASPEIPRADAAENPELLGAVTSFRQIGTDLLQAVDGSTVVQVAMSRTM